MHEKRIPVSFRVSAKFKACLMLAAEHEQRSQTNFLEKLLFDYCEREGLEPVAFESTNTNRSRRKSPK